MTPEFVDTNVLLYAYDPSAEGRHDLARQLVGRLGRTRSGVISVQVLQEFYVSVTRKVAVPATPVQAQNRLEELARWPAHSPRPADVVAAARLAEESMLSFWDAMIVRSAAQMQCPVLWSEDLNDGQIVSGVQIRNPFSSSSVM